MEKEAVQVSKGVLLLQDICGNLEKGGRKEAVLRVCENDAKKLVEPTPWPERPALRSVHSFVENMPFWSEDLKKAGWST